jgi:hypothetical protein
MRDCLDRIRAEPATNDIDEQQRQRQQRQQPDGDVRRTRGSDGAAQK